jgi:NAD(P)-dependent dehydrogenase (short-subunit alcohol dehydrogenase family)
MQNQFTDKVVLVTGAATGIGAATAEAFAGQGAKVVLADINPLAQAVAEKISALGGEAVFHECDVTQEASVVKLVEFIIAKFGHLDVAFNNAGIDIETSKMADAEENVFDKLMDVNVKGVWLCMKQEILAMLLTGGGAIVNTASVAGLGAAPKMGIYSATKHAVIGLTKSAAVEYAKKGIRVNAVCPAVIDTPMYRRALDSDPKKALAIASMHPVGRVGKAEEIAAAVLYLSSEQAGFTTGIALPVDGGSTAI